MIHVRDEGGVIRTGFNVYPCGSGSVGFILKLGRYRWMLRYSRMTGWLDCYGWRDK